MPGNKNLLMKTGKNFIQMIMTAVVNYQFTRAFIAYLYLHSRTYAL
jgi:hypothetical protein